MLWSSKNWKKWLPATLKIKSHPSGSPKLRLASKSPIPFGKLFALPSLARRNGSHGEDSPPGLFPHRRCIALVKMCVFCLGRDSPPKITVFFGRGGSGATWICWSVGVSRSTLTRHPGPESLHPPKLRWTLRMSWCLSETYGKGHNFWSEFCSLSRVKNQKCCCMIEIVPL